MKILRLDLRAFGPFTHASLEFPAEGPGLHLIHGPNEAGKSSALRAIECLFFGFAHQNEYDFVHDAKKLRVGATLQGKDGSSLGFLRRKGRDKTLLQPDDKTPIDETQLARYLPRMGEKRFQKLYVSTLADLTRGGNEIISGTGEFGTVLFSGAGLSQMPGVLRSLEEDAKKLYSATARVPEINSLLSKLDAAKHQARLDSLSGEQWKANQDQLDETIRKRDAIKAELDRIGAEQNRLGRLNQARPILARRNAARDALNDLGPVVPLSADFATRRSEADTALAIAVAAATERRRSIGEAEAKFAAIESADRLIEQAGSINALRERLGTYRKAREDRPKRARELQQAEDLTLSLLQAIDPAKSLDDGTTLRTSKERKPAITALGRQRGVLLGADLEVQTRVRSIEAEQAAGGLVERDRNARQVLDELDALIVRIKALGNLDETYRTALDKIQKHEKAGTKSLQALPIWKRSLDDLSSVPFPSPETVARFSREWHESEQERKALDQELRTLSDDLRDTDREIETDRLISNPPSQADLDHMRANRDEAWRRIRKAWVGGEVVESAPDLAAEFERTVAKADHQADLLRSEAERVAKRAERVARRHDLAERSEAAAERFSLAQSRAERIATDWNGIWAPAGIEPLPPAEMRDWLTRRETALVALERIATARDEAASIRRKCDDEISAISAILIILNELPPTSVDSLAAWLARAESVAGRGAVALALAKARIEAQKTAAALDDWRARWAEAIAPLGLRPDASPEESDAALDRHEAASKSAEKVVKLRDALAEIDTEITTFTDDLRQLILTIGIESDDRGPDLVLDSLNLALTHATTLGQELRAERRGLHEAEAEITRQTAILAELCREAHRERSDELPEAVRLSDAARGFTALVQDEESRLHDLSGNGSIDDLAREAATLDADTLPTRIEALADRVRGLRSDLQSLNESVGTLRTELTAKGGGEGASVENEKIQQYLTELEAKVEQYARVRLAEAIVRKAIESYRQRNQGPILARTNALFSSLTAGSFARVELVDESSGTGKAASPILRGIRALPPHESVPVEGMSEGTADALHLAVRLATLEHHLDEHEPMPFIVDDILVHFDDARASAALCAMEQLSRKTQVLFFTHHRHLIDLAETALRRDSWSLHQLPGRVELALTAPASQIE